MENWYVIQVKSGLEEKTRNTCSLLISKTILSHCFIPYVTKMKKINGEWQKKEEILFKGYIFLISKDVIELYQELKKVPELTKLLGRDHEDIYPLRREDIVFLKAFGKEDSVIDMSMGHIIGERIIVTSGPLVGKEGLIKKIDRHKRIAYLEIEFLGKVTMAKVGLEIISKSI